MNTATIAFRTEESNTFRLLAARIGARLRRAIELSAAPYLVMGSRYL